MSDWTTDQLLAGRAVSEKETNQSYRDAMADPETVTLVVKGRNGHTVQIRINSHERTRLVLEQSYDQERPPDYDWYLGRPEMWAPRWKRSTWTVESHISYRPEDWDPR